jgi:hypothetical protein
VADYAQQIDDLKAAAAICERHVITSPVNGIQPDYPRWPEAWKACEKVWRVYLDMSTVEGEAAEADRHTVIMEAGRLR